MTLQPNDIDYFNRGEYENLRFWLSFGGKPDFRGLTVIDLGCGHGSLCIDMALAGAKKVIGLDLDQHRIDFAIENLRCNYPHLNNIVEFRSENLQDSPPANIDLFVSKDTFEHVLGLEQVLAAMKQRLKTGGQIYTGFGPLWNSPIGDHHRTKMTRPWGPWGHVMFSESYIVNRLNRRRQEKITSIYDLGLNKMSLDDYLRVFREIGLLIRFLKTNVNVHLPLSKRFVSRVFSLLNKIHPLKEYFTHNLYCILEKPAPELAASARAAKEI